MRFAIGLGVLLLGMLILLLSADLVTSKLFLLSVGNAGAGYEPPMMPRLWATYGVDPVYHARMLKIALGVLFVVSVGVSVLLLLMRRVSDLHGRARFASRSELAEAGLFAKQGILFGRYGREYLCLGGQRHVLVIAPTRSGKTACIATPNLLNWSGSIVATDVKLELFHKTSGFRAAHGHDVFLFAPFAQDFRTNCWNPLDGVRRGANGQGVYTMQDLMAIATVLYPTKAGDETSKFFATQAQNLFVGLALLVLETKGLPFTISQVLKMSAGKVDGGLPEFLRGILQQRVDLSAQCRDSLLQFLSATGDTLSSIKATFDAPLLVFRNPLVAAATDRSDFKLSELRRRRMSIYLGVSPRDMEMGSVLLTLFMSQVLHSNLDALPEHDPTLKHELLLLMDEFRVLGKMSVLVDASGYVAGYNVRLLTILQSQGQLVELYGREGARSFMTNHGVKVVFAPREQEDARDVSEALGTFTEMSESYSRNTSGGRIVNHQGGGGSVGISASAQRRALMLPQEVKVMPFKDEIAFVEGVMPVKAEKMYYLEDEAFRGRLYPPVSIAALPVDASSVERQQTPVAVPVSMPHEQGAGAAVTAPASTNGPLQIDAQLLDERFADMQMKCADPENPSAGEVKQFVDGFMDRLKGLGAWQ